jgi:GxxExxY protein
MGMDHRGHRGTTEEIHPELSRAIIGAALKVHTGLGPGLLESAYEECLCYELIQAGLSFKRQVPVPLRYGAITLTCGFRLDLLVDNRAIVEVKAVDRLVPRHDCQLITYLRLANKRLGLLLNFNVAHMRLGIRRLVL